MPEKDATAGDLLLQNAATLQLYLTTEINMFVQNINGHSDWLVGQCPTQHIIGHFRDD